MAAQEVRPQQLHRHAQPLRARAAPARAAMPHPARHLGPRIGRFPARAKARTRSSGPRTTVPLCGATVCRALCSCASWCCCRAEVVARAWVASRKFEVAARMMSPETPAARATSSAA
eukprot:scaffold4325_cov79-Phaeocystis_antarctica.AAC.1